MPIWKKVVIALVIAVLVAAATVTDGNVPRATAMVMEPVLGLIKDFCTGVGLCGRGSPAS